LLPGVEGNLLIASADKWDVNHESEKMLQMCKRSNAAGVLWTWISERARTQSPSMLESNDEMKVGKYSFPFVYVSFELQNHRITEW